MKIALVFFLILFVLQGQSVSSKNLFNYMNGSHIGLVLGYHENKNFEAGFSFYERSVGGHVPYSLGISLTSEFNKDRAAPKFTMWADGFIVGANIELMYFMSKFEKEWVFRPNVGLSFWGSGIFYGYSIPFDEDLPGNLIRHSLALKINLALFRI